MSVDLNKINTQMATFSEKTADAVSSHTVNPDDQKSMIELQQKMHQWTLATQMQSNSIKTVSEAIKSIISNVR